MRERQGQRMFPHQPAQNSLNRQRARFARLATRATLLSACLMTLPVAATFGQQPASQPAPGQSAAPQTSQAQQQPTAVPANAPMEAEAPQTLHLLVGRSIVITSPARIKRVSIADPRSEERRV